MTDFETFWSVYPRKLAKQNALKAWKKLNPDAELFEKIMQAIRLQKQSKQWQQDGGRFIPYPATWLNAKRWEDEVIIAQRYGNFDAEEAFRNALKRSMGQ